MRGLAELVRKVEKVFRGLNSACWRLPLRGVWAWKSPGRGAAGAV